jgi:hypothetical protein
MEIDLALRTSQPIAPNGHPFSNGIVNALEACIVGRGIGAGKRC